MNEKTFSWPIRVYYESTDAGGVVYHAEYLKFFERARTEWLRHLGLEQTELRERDDVIFVVRAMQIQYRLPARFNDLLQVISCLKSMGRSRFVFEQCLWRGDEILNQATVEVACVSAGAFRPVALPLRIRQHFEKVLT